MQSYLTANMFVSTHIRDSKGNMIRVRRTGQNKTWVTRPNEFRIPIKYGLYQSGYITHENMNEWKPA